MKVIESMYVCLQDLLFKLINHALLQYNTKKTLLLVSTLFLHQNHHHETTCLFNKNTPHINFTFLVRMNCKLAYMVPKRLGEKVHRAQWWPRS